jgi:hypothetical protein
VRPQRIDLAIRLVASLVTAGVICGIAWSVGPGSFDIRTDIVGYPIAQDFNPRTYTFRYLLIAVAFPVLAIGTWWALGLLAKRQGSPPGTLLPRSLPADEDDRAAARAGATPLAYLKLAAVGLLIATAVAIGVDASSAWPLTIGIPVVVAYVGLARLAAGLVPAERAGSTLDALSAINAAVGALSLLAIGVAATATQVVIDNPPQTVDYEFVPLWAVAVAALAAGALVCWLLWRSPASEWRRIEVWTLLLVVAPVGLFLWIAFLPGEQPPLDYFHEGERLGASNLVFGNDEFPWRDVLFAHGLLSDVLLPELNTALVEHSRWGMIAGQDLIEWPLLWISMLALSIYLYRRNWVFLVATQLLLVFGWFDEFRNSRLILVPLSLLALALLLERSTWPRAIGLMAITVAQVVVAPEAVVYSVAVWAVVIAFELVHHRAEGAEPLRTSRTVRCAVAGVGLLAGIAVFLGAEGALDEFVGYYRTFIGGHELTGTFPIEWTDLKFRVWVYLPVAVIVIAWGYAAARVWSRRWLTIPDWVVGASVIGLIPYYVKFLARADEGHLYQVATMALIPALYVVYRCVQFVDRRAEDSRRPLLRYRPATLAFLVFVCVLVSSPLDTIRELPGQYSARAAEAPQNGRLGYAIPGGDEVLVRRVQRVVDKYAQGGTVFDFTNSPAMFDYLVDARPATRFFHVSMAVRAPTQEDVIDELRSEQPELVAYSSTIHGLSNWDVTSNPVRHYLISDYLLDNYHPVARADDYVFMARNRDPVAPPEVSDPRGLLFEGLPCEWGYAPNFLNDEPSDPESATDLGATLQGPSTGAGGWAVDVEAGRPAAEVLVADGDRVVATAGVGVRRPDIALTFGSTGVIYSGFEFRGLLPPRYADDPEALSYFGVARSGVASELGSPVEPPPGELRMPDGGRVRVEQDVVQGTLDYRLPVMARYKLDAPEDFHDFDWLAISATPAPDGSRFILSDGEAGGTRSIAFSALPDRDSLQVRVGACSQWKGYASGPLYVDVTPGTGPVSARMIR